MNGSEETAPYPESGIFGSTTSSNYPYQTEESSPYSSSSPINDYTVSDPGVAERNRFIILPKFEKTNGGSRYLCTGNIEVRVNGDPIRGSRPRRRGIRYPSNGFAEIRRGPCDHSGGDH